MDEADDDDPAGDLPVQVGLLGGRGGLAQAQRETGCSEQVAHSTLKLKALHEVETISLTPQGELHQHHQSIWLHVLLRIPRYNL